MQQRGKETLRDQRKSELEDATATLQMARESIEDTGLSPSSDKELEDLVQQLELETSKIKELTQKEVGRPPTPYPAVKEHQQLDWFECTRIGTCRFHQFRREAARRAPGWDSHQLIPTEECEMKTECRVHFPTISLAHHQRNGWARCYNEDCKTHEEEKHIACYWPEGPNQGAMELCEDEDCLHTHPLRGHMSKQWYNCKAGCPFHRVWKKAAMRNHRDPTHVRVAQEECQDQECEEHTQESPSKN